MLSPPCREQFKYDITHGRTDRELPRTGWPDESEMSNNRFRFLDRFRYVLFGDLQYATG